MCVSVTIVFCFKDAVNFPFQTLGPKREVQTECAPHESLKSDEFLPWTNGGQLFHCVVHRRAVSSTRALAAFTIVGLTSTSCHQQTHGSSCWNIKTKGTSWCRLEHSWSNLLNVSLKINSVPTTWSSLNDSLFCLMFFIQFLNIFPSKTNVLISGSIQSLKVYLCKVSP